MTLGEMVASARATAERAFPNQVSDVDLHDLIEAARTLVSCSPRSLTAEMEDIVVFEVVRQMLEGQKPAQSAQSGRDLLVAQDKFLAELNG